MLHKYDLSDWTRISMTISTSDNSHFLPLRENTLIKDCRQPATSEPVISHVTVVIITFLEKPEHTLNNITCVRYN